MNRPVTVAVVQTDPAFGDPAGNRSAIADAVGSLPDADLIVLPELATTGYRFESRDELADLAERRDGPTVTGWRELAAETGAWLVGGFAERRDGRLLDSAAVVSPAGLETVYRKAHLWGDERELFDPGDELPVVEAPFGRFGVAICHDLWVPETSRTLALRGAELLAVPANWPVRAPRPGGWPRGVHLSIATADTDGVAVAVADRVGGERGARFEGSSLIVGRDGGIRAGPASGDEAGTALATVELAGGGGTLDDRRPGLYEA